MTWRLGIWGGALAAAAMAVTALVWLLTADFAAIDILRFDDVSRMPTLGEGHTVVQTFVAPRDGLSRVDLNIEPGPSATGRLQFDLLESPAPDRLPSGEPLRELDVDIGSLESEGMQRFRFEPVAGSGGKTYAVQLTGTGDVSPRGSAGNVLPAGVLFVDGKPTGGDLSLAVYHTSGIGGLLEKNLPFRPPVLSSPAFFVTLFTVAAASFGWLLWTLAASQPPARGPDEPSGAVTGPAGRRPKQIQPGDGT
jgi:hypothetical protein